MLWQIKDKLGIAPSEIDFAAIEIANLVKIRGVVMSAELNQVCNGMTESEIKKVVRRLKRYKIERREGMLQYSKKIVGDAEIRENELNGYLIAKEYPEVTSDLIRIGTRFYEGIVATGFPEVAKGDWLDRISREMENLDYSIFIVPEPLRNLEIYLNDQLKQVEAELYNFTKKNISNPELEKNKKKLQEQLENIAKGKYVLYKMSLYLLSKGVNEEETKALSNKIISALHSDGVEGKYATNYQKQVFASIMPSGTDFLGGRQIIANSTTLSMSFPFKK